MLEFDERNPLEIRKDVMAAVFYGNFLTSIAPLRILSGQIGGDDMMRLRRCWLVMAAPVFLLGPIAGVVADASPASASEYSHGWSGTVPAGVHQRDYTLKCEHHGGYVEGETPGAAYNDKPKVTIHDSALGHHLSWKDEKSVGHKFLARAVTEAKFTVTGVGAVSSTFLVQVYCTSDKNHAWNVRF
jgi:hypothetical protein